MVEVEDEDDDAEGGDDAAGSPGNERAAVQQRLINLITSPSPIAHFTFAGVLTYNMCSSSPGSVVAAAGLAVPSQIKSWALIIR